MKKYLKSYGIAFIIVAIYSFVKLPVLRLDFTSGFTTLIFRISWNNRYDA